MKKTTAIFAALLAAVTLTGCGGESSSVPTEIVIDGTSAEPENSVFPVKLPDGTVIEAAPETVASLSPAATEILAELGYSDRLCAVCRYCDYPEDLVKVQVGSSENPDIDKLVELSPDVVFTLSALAEREIYTLETAGITVVDLTAPTSVEEYGELYGTVTAVFEGEEAAEVATEKAVSRLKSAASAVELGTFVYVTPKLTAAGADTFEGAALSLCGKNICTGEGYAAMTEDISEIPQYIIAADSLTENEFSGSELYSGMISGGAKLVFVPAERFERPSARIAEVFSAISEQLAQTAE